VADPGFERGERFLLTELLISSLLPPFPLILPSPPLPSLSSPSLKWRGEEMQYLQAIFKIF